MKFAPTSPEGLPRVARRAADQPSEYDQLVQQIHQRLKGAGDPAAAARLLDLASELHRVMLDDRSRADLLDALSKIASARASERASGPGEVSSSALNVSGTGLASGLASGLPGALRSPLFGPSIGRVGPLAASQSSLDISRGNTRTVRPSSVAFRHESTFMDASRSQLGGEPSVLMTGPPGGLQNALAHAPPRAPTLDVEGPVMRAQVEAARASALPETENALVRDVLLSCQGVAGTYLKYEEGGAGPQNQGYVPRGVPGAGLPKPAEELVRRMGELGWLFRRTSAFVEEPGGSATQAALKAALRRELAEHYRMVATLQEQAVLGERAQSGPGGSMTLRRLSAWLCEPIERMKLLAVMADVGQVSKGGMLLRKLDALGLQGSPWGRALVHGAMRQAAAPLLEMMALFCSTGALTDPHGEMFIVEHRRPRGWPSSDPNQGVGGPSADRFDLWRDGFSLEMEMLPPFVDEGAASAILRAGKTATFLRLCCDDSTWEEEEAFRALQEGMAGAASAGLMPAMRDDAHLEARPLLEMATEMAAALDRRLKSTMLDQHKLARHVESVRGYLLLAHGDFASHLVSLLAPILHDPATDIAEGDLMRALVTALRARAPSGKDDDGEDAFADLLSVGLDPRCFDEGGSGWDHLRVGYRVGAPLTTVLTPARMRDYAKISGLLLRLKRAELALGQIWQQLKPNADALRSKFLRVNYERDPDPEVQFARRFAVLMQQATLVRSSMAHFVTSLQAYFTFEVVEVEWHELQSKISEAEDLECVIKAHDEWTERLLMRLLLADQDDKSASGQTAVKVMRKLVGLLDSVLEFSGVVDQFGDMTARASHLQALKEQQHQAQGQLLAELDQQVQAVRQEIAVDTGNMALASKALHELGDKFDRGIDGFAELLKTVTQVDARGLIAKISR